MVARPVVDSTEFGSITIDGVRYDHDVVIGLDGRVRRRQKALSRAVYGTSHTLSLDEVRDLYESGAQVFLVGTGQMGLAKLSDEAARFLGARSCEVHLLRTAEAINAWNQAGDGVIALFHVTC